ncbi:MAG TPA: carbonic anhydrase family protein [Ureibacillus sp.]|nr:carbonic anhydrase family protein [Ureibacillus sp.]
MSRKKYYLLLLSVQIAVAIIVYVSLSSVPSENMEVENKENEAKQVYWTYEEENGPTKWVSVDPSYLACGGGNEQSPINITDASVWEKQIFENVELDYYPTKFLIENTGYTIEAKDPTAKNMLTIDGNDYQLKGVHFHIPSEHQLNGQTFNMEGHLVHQTKEGKIAVIGFLIEEGKVNTDFAEMWSLLPTEKTEQPVELKHSIDLLEVLPNDKTMYQYSGSLTTPPCTEGVTWILYKQPVEMSAQQIEAFAHIFHQNARPLQPLNNRKVYKNN